MCPTGTSIPISGCTWNPVSCYTGEIGNSGKNSNTHCQTSTKKPMDYLVTIPCNWCHPTQTQIPSDMKHVLGGQWWPRPRALIHMLQRPVNKIPLEQWQSTFKIEEEKNLWGKKNLIDSCQYILLNYTGLGGGHTVRAVLLLYWGLVRVKASSIEKKADC